MTEFNSTVFEGEDPLIPLSKFWPLTFVFIYTEDRIPSPWKNMGDYMVHIIWANNIFYSNIKLGRCEDSFGGMYVGSLCWYRQNWFSLCKSRWVIYNESFLWVIKCFSEPKSTRMLSSHLSWFDCRWYHLLRSWWSKFWSLLPVQKS